MSKLSYRISYYVLYAMFAVILVVLGLFYFGGDAAPIPSAPEMQNPVYTDALLYLQYGLLGFGIAVTIIAVIFQFGAALKDNPVGALKSLAGIVLLVVIMIVAWSMGSDKPLVLQGYDGNENVPFWLKVTDMFLYGIYILFAGTILAMLFSSVKKMLS